MIQLKSTLKPMFSHLKRQLHDCVRAELLGLDVIFAKRVNLKLGNV